MTLRKLILSLIKNLTTFTNVNLSYRYDIINQLM